MALGPAVVTGGAGFLGSHLIDRLIAEGEEVLCVDNFRTGAKANIAHLLAHPRFELIRHSVWLPLYVEAGSVYNLACPASPVQYQTDPVGTTKTAVLGTINMLGLARRCRVRLLQASTSEVYGDPQRHPQPEDYWGHVNPIGLRACYDEGKRCAETLCMDYHRQYGVEVRIVRIFNTYGPRMRPDDGRVVSRFVVQALRGEPLTVFGDGSQTRSFCYVSDLVEGMVRMMRQEGDLGPVNLGNPEEVTILDLAERVLRLSGSASRIEFRPLPQDDPVQRQPDISKAKAVLGWAPTVSLEDGLKETIAWFRRALG